MSHGKKYQKAAALVDPKKSYSLAEAVKILKQTTTTKFDSSVEVHARLGIDPAKGDQQVRGNISLPPGTGKEKRVAAFVEGEKVKEAKEAGADLIGGPELVDEIKKSGKCDFDVAVATPDMMKVLSGVARILGPKGLMPNPKNDTVTMQIGKVVGELKKGKVSFKNDDTGNVHQLVGKISWDEAKLQENIQAMVDAITKAKPSSSKGVYLQKVVLTTTMGPGIRLAL